jgi:cellulose synthase/poly-beta-1,6-N-acetylglucosamine synthase-like glycosyltransferase
VEVISTPLLIYLVIGPLAWVLMFIGTWMGRVRMGKLLRWKGKLPDSPPRVTVLIPAKDEADGIGRCLEAVFAMDYPDFDVIAIDDRSTDGTGRILDELAEREKRLRVVHVPHGGLPAGWLGKCHALHLGAKHATGEWLFFVDSDVTVEPAALATALSIAIERKYDAVSILTRVECNSFLEQLMLPPLAAAWAVMHAVSRTNQDSAKESAAANGQFFLIRRETYEKVGGHEAVKDQITEDVELMRKLKSEEFTVRLFMGSHLASTRMHSTMQQLFNGWGRIYSGTPRRKPWRILMAMQFLITAVFSVYPALGWGLYRVISSHDQRWLLAAGAHMVMMTLYLMLIYVWSGNRARYALLIPASGAIMLAIFAFSLRKCQTGRITWRGTEFAAPQGGSAQSPS